MNEEDDFNSAGPSSVVRGAGARGARGGQGARRARGARGVRGRGAAPRTLDCPDCGTHLARSYMPRHWQLYCRGAPDEEESNNDEESDDDEDGGDDGAALVEILQDVQEVEETIRGHRISMGQGAGVGGGLRKLR